jgi:MFS-type transporter involved in bile tolerance (Atg22 family)
MKFRMGNGALIMSNIFLSTAFITLGQRSLGCKDDDEICDGEVFGFKPGSLITLVATVTGLMAAFLLPLIGAVVDYTNHRKKLGAIFAIVSLLIQAAQVFTYEANWFFMLILQAVNGFNYQALAVAAYAYLQEIKRDVGEEKLVNYASRYYVCMFGIEATFLVIVIGAALAISADDVLTAQMSQGVNVIVSGGFYYLAFHFFSKKDSVRKLPDGENLVCAAFKSVFVTARGVVKHYPSTLTWFLLAVVFGQAGKFLITVDPVQFKNYLVPENCIYHKCIPDYCFIQFITLLKLLVLSQQLP